MYNAYLGQTALYLDLVKEKKRNCHSILNIEHHVSDLKPLCIYLDYVADFPLLSNVILDVAVLDFLELRYRVSLFIFFFFLVQQDPWKKINK